MALSSTGKKKMLAYAFIIVVDIAVLVLSVLVNTFQEFFFMADLFPLIISTVTLGILLLQIVLDFTSENPFTTRPAFEIPLLGTLTIFWLAFNSFSTSRYTGLPNCSIFPDDLADERAWCRNVQGLRVIIWVEWAALLLTTLMLTRISTVQARRGNTAIWHTALSRYHPNKQSGDFLQDASSFYRGSSIFGFDRVNGHQKDSSMTSRDWFAPAEIRLSGRADSQRDTAVDPFFDAGRAGAGVYGDGIQSAVPLQHQTSSPTRSPAVPRTIDGFEIVSMGYYFQNEGNWNQGGPQPRR